MNSAAATRVEAVVVGGGVIGLAVARALAARGGGGRQVLLLERNTRIGMETSARNSEVIHAGLYYPANSHKANWCVQGNKLLYQYCRERQIAVNPCGKLVVATTEQQLERIQALHQQALGNGVSDIQLLTREQVLELEPQVSTACEGALWSPSTGIVDSHGFMTSLMADAEEDGTTVALNTPVTDAKLIQQRVHLYADMWLDCGVVVNACGLWADRVARTIHQGGTWQPPRQFFCKGTYFRLQGHRSPFQHLIYPVPDPRGGLGVHATLDSSGQIKLGPDVEWLPIDQDPDSIDYTPDPDRAQSFYESCRQYWPDLPEDSLVPDYAGVRPKLSHPSLQSTPASNQFHDFVIAGPEAHGVPGLVHLFGMESPGLTSSLAIADYVADLLRTSY